MRKKNTIRLNESTLKRIIKESVKRVLRESKRPIRQTRRRSLNESSYFDKEDEMILKQNGLDPKLVSALCSPEVIPIHNDEMEDGIDYTDDFGIDIDTDDGDIRVYINAEGYFESESGCVVRTIKDMCEDLKKGQRPEDIWYDLSFNWAL